MRTVDKIYLVTHRYDLSNLFPCLASIKYWYPDIEIVIIKNLNNGNFNLNFLKNYFHVSFMYETDYSYGKFYGSLEPFLTGKDERFIILDTDTVLTGKIIDFIELKNEDFIIDFEQQPLNKVRDLYWDPELISCFINNFSDSWFTFNNGIIAGVGNKITKSDFNDFMIWEKYKEPLIINQSVFPTYDQSAINVVLNKKFSQKQISLTREKIMIYPSFFTESVDDLLKGIENKDAQEFRIIHWADTKSIAPSQKPLSEIFIFYTDNFFESLSYIKRFQVKIYISYLKYEFYVMNRLKLFYKNVWYKLKLK